MRINFCYTHRAAKLPETVPECLTLLQAIRAEVIGTPVDDFCFLARITLVKDEALFDKFDRAFAAYFKGVEMPTDFRREVPLDWQRKTLELEPGAEDKAAIENMGRDAARLRREHEHAHAGDPRRARLPRARRPEPGLLQHAPGAQHRLPGAVVPRRKPRDPETPQQQSLVRRVL